MNDRLLLIENDINQPFIVDRSSHIYATTMTAQLNTWGTLVGLLRWSWEVVIFHRQIKQVFFLGGGAVVATTSPPAK